jgi:HlyD family secretion protein
MRRVTQHLTAAVSAAIGLTVMPLWAQPGPVRLHGTVEAVRSQTVIVPRLAGQTLPNLVITHLVKPGQAVKPGDLLIEFDRQEQRRIAFDRQAELSDLDEQINRRRADHAAVRAKDETEIKAAEHDVERAQLEMRKNPLLPRVEAQKNQLALEQAEARFAQLKMTFDLKRKAEGADIRILEIRRERAERALNYAEHNAGLMEVRAPFEGLAVIKTTFRNSGMVEIQQGDEVRPGIPIIDIVDPSAMQVRLKVNQADVPRLKVGQTATVRLDGFPELTFKGKVVAIGPLAVRGNFSSHVRSFTALVQIEGTHPQLMPDLTASVEIAGGL